MCDLTRVSAAMVKDCREFLGPEGLEYFKGWMDEFGSGWSTACREIPIAPGRSVPHPVHLRNHMRGSGLWGGFSDHELDAYWSILVEMAVRDQCACPACGRLCPRARTTWATGAPTPCAGNS